MRVTLIRLTYVAILWTGAGLGCWLFGSGFGATGALLGMVSGADLYRSLQDRPRRFWLMFLLGIIGVPFGLLYEYFLSTATAWPSLLKVLVFGLVVGGLFSFVSSAVGFLFGVRSVNRHKELNH